MKKFLSISLFLSLCVILFAQSKMSPNTRHMVTSLKQSGLAALDTKAPSKGYLLRSVGQETYVNAYIYLNNNSGYDALEEHGVKVNSKFPGIVTATIPVDKVEEIAGLKEVKYVQIGSPVYKLMDNARVTTQADKVQAGLDLAGAFRGTGVVIGIIDSGFEYGHPNFYNSDKTGFRIKKVWDQNGKQGLPPKAFSYGTEHKTEADILAAKFDGTETHGSHVTGIAAGADTTNNAFYGMAPDADIVLVSMNTTNEESDNVAISDGIKYIYDYATSVGKPCVINMSLGLHTGPHDGTSSFDVLADAMQGKGKLLVGAAGNEGDDNLHLSETFASESKDSLNSFIRFLQGYPMSVLDVWGDIGMKYTVQLQIFDRSKKTVKKYYSVVDASVANGNEKNFSLKLKTDGAEGNIYVITEISPLNNKPHAYIYTELSSIQNTCCIGFSIKPLSAGTVHVWSDDVFSVLTNYNISGYTMGDSECSVGEIGGTGKKIISTGAYTSKNKYKDFDGSTRTTGQSLGEITSFSSLGPTPDGRIKPDIAAPGSTVGSSISSRDSDLRSRSIVNETTWNDKTYYYAVMDGTSMASPCVTGILATWLQANKELAPEDIRAILKKTSIRDTDTGTLPEEGNNTWGFGKIDAWNGIKESLRIGNPESIASESMPTIMVIPSNRGFNLLFTGECTDANVAVYDINGKKTYSLQLDRVSAGEEIPITPNITNQGVYIVKVSGSQVSLTSKLVIR